jgi:peptide/nickel transport system permease protein
VKLARLFDASIVLRQLAHSPLARAGAVAILVASLLAVFADVLASDLPVLARTRGATYILPCVTEPAALSETSCRALRDASAEQEGEWAFCALVPYGPSTTTGKVLAPPSGEHPFGTDARGRDVFSRVVHGARTSLGVGLAAVFAFVTIGVIFGAFAGFFGGVFDALLTRVVETIAAFPTLVFVIVVQALLEKPGTLTMVLAIALTRWTEVARLVRAEVIVVAAEEYTLAARALGASPFRVLRKHVLPNALVPALVAGTFGVASVVLIEASLAFLGLGAPDATASWGETLGQARHHFGAYWLLVFPGVALFATVASLNLLGEALRDALDPRLRDAPARAMQESPRADASPPSAAAFDDSAHA